MSYEMIVNGKPVETTEQQEVPNPATGAVVGHSPVASAAQVDEAVAAARAAQPAWAARSSEERAGLIMQCAELFAANAGPLAKLITEEQGKPLSGPGSNFEMEAVVGWTQVPASLDLPPEVVFEDETRRDELHYGPLGVVAAIAPWNWPAMIAIWQIVPSIRMGNTVVIKPSEYTPLSTLEIVRLMNEVLPPGVVNSVAGAGEVGAALTANPDVDKIMFTGSAATGQKVAEAASASLARVTLELGGNDAAIICDDVNPAEIAEGLFWGAFINMGQTCACAKRIYVHESIHDQLVEALAGLAAAMPMGDGLDEANVLGPVQNPMQLGIVRDLVDDAKANGATVVVGGEEPDGPGNFYPITIVTGLDNGSRLVDEEQFGPVVPIIAYSDIEDALAKANALDVGLGASVWSSDPERAAAIAARMEAGTVWINSHGMIHPMSPFGGAKGSGFGLEFGVEGLKAVSQPKLISLTKAPAAG
ncbi:MAG: aldehyde dehydrogenase family protein [Actinomycetota bacterium]